MNTDTIRLAAAAALIWWGLGMPGLKGGGVIPFGPRAPYAGAMTELHAAAGEMEAKDRAILSDALVAGGEMVRADSRKLLDSTSEANDFFIGLMTFDYAGLAKPSTKYPRVADELEKQFRSVVGDDIASMDDSQRSRFADFLIAAGEAIH